MKRASAPRYDLFKLLVTMALAVILILMLLRGCATSPASPLPLENSPVSDPTQSVRSPTETETPPAASPVDTITPSPAPLATPTTAATRTPTSAATTTTTEPTTNPEVTATEPSTPVEATVTPSTADSSSCNTRVPSRLSVGQEAQVLQRLNMRNAASITAPILQTNSTSTRVEIIGGPVCTPVGERAYLWWQIRLADGTEGWSAESQLNERSYLLEPIQ